LSLEYGYRVCSDCLDNEDIIKREREDCAEAIEKVLKDNYTQLFFISKSAGHFISLKIDERYKDRNLRHICYTPVTDNACDIASRNCQVFIGTKDKWISKEAVSRIQNVPNVELYMIENAVHSLEIDDDFKASIKILGKVTEFCAEYIKRYMD
jgi:hypothetical protein